MPITQKFTSYLQYIPPKLTEGKVWFVSYYALNPENQQLQRIRIKLNRIKSITQRRAIARKIVSDLTVKLASGWNPFIETSAPKSYNSIFSALDDFLVMKEKETEDATMRSYRSYVKKLKDYLDSLKFEKDTFVNSLQKEFATNFMINLKMKKTISPASYNNHLAFYRLFWNWLIEYNYAKENPFTNISKQPRKLTDKKRITLSEHDRESLRDYLVGQNLNYYIMCLFCYYCFMRPKEIALLKIGDINIKKQQVFISKEIAKNDHDSYRTIPDYMLKYILQINLQYPSSFYLFGDGPGYSFNPSKKSVSSRKIAKYWQDHIRPALKWSMDLQFYSLKDTGITNMLSDGTPVNFVQSQADHSSIAITSKYVQTNPNSVEDIKKATAF